MVIIIDVDISQAKHANVLDDFKLPLALFNGL
jgi:hypothetical protein